MDEAHLEGAHDEERNEKPAPDEAGEGKAAKGRETEEARQHEADAVVARGSWKHPEKRERQGSEEQEHAVLLPPESGPDSPEEGEREGERRRLHQGQNEAVVPREAPHVDAPQVVGVEGPDLPRPSGRLPDEAQEARKGVRPPHGTDEEEGEEARPHEDREARDRSPFPEEKDP